MVNNTTYTPRWYEDKKTQVATQPTVQAATQPNTGIYQPYVPPTTTQVGLSDQERGNIYGLARRQEQGGWNAAAESLKRNLGGRGFRVGESGIADSALGNLYATGAERMGQNASALAAEEAKNRFSQGLNLDLLGLEKNKWGQEFGASREDQSTSDLMSYLALMGQNQAQVYAPYWQGLVGNTTSQFGG